jgi:hypothetical protein
MSEMAQPERDGLQFVVEMALRSALKLVRGLRKQIGEREEAVMAAALIREINRSNYQIVRRPGAPGHTFEAPIGPLAEPD